MESITFTFVKPTKLKAPTRVARPNPILPQGERFSGGQKGQEGIKDSLRKGFLLPAALMAALSPAIKADDNNFTTTTDTHGIEHLIRPSDIAAGKVNSPADIPDIQPPVQQTVFDSKTTPWLSKTARLELEGFLHQLFAAQVVQMKVVLVPSSNEKSAQRLGNNIFNTNLKPGRPVGDWGAVQIFINNRCEASLPEKAAFIPSDVLKSGLGGYFTQSESFKILKSTAVPHCQKVKNALAQGNYQLAQQERDAAVLETVKALGNMISSNKPAAAPPPIAETPQQQAERERREAAEWAQTKETALQVLGYLGILLAGGTAVGATGVVLKRRRDKAKKLQPTIETIKAPLIEMGSSYKVTKDNFKSVETLKHLLDTSTGVEANTTRLLKAIATLYQNTSEAEQMAYLPVLIEKGLIHPNFQIRKTCVEQQINDGLDRSDYEPFIALLKNESTKEIVDLLIPAIEKIATQEDVPGFTDRLKNSTQPQIRFLAIQVLRKFHNQGTVPLFFEALQKEDVPGLIQDLQKAIGNFATDADEQLLLGGIDKQKPTRIQQASLVGFAKVANKAHFETLYATFKENQNKALTTHFQAALGATVSKANTTTLTADLQNPSSLVQETALGLLAQLKAPETVPALFEYLEAQQTAYPEEATQVLIASLNKSHIPLLLQKIESDDPMTEDKEVMMAAIQGLRKFEDEIDSATLQRLGQALERQVSPNVIAALTKAMRDSGETDENFAFFNKLLTTSNNPHVRIAAITSLADFGMDALDPLFNALSVVAESDPESTILQKEILKLGRTEKALPTLLSKANHRNPLVKNTAIQGVLVFIQDWQERKSYDDSATVSQLRQLANNDNHLIRSAANNAYQRLVN